MCTKFVECLIYYDVDLLYMQVGFANAESKTTEANKIDQINVIGFSLNTFDFLPLKIRRDENKTQKQRYSKRSQLPVVLWHRFEKTKNYNSPR